MAEGLKAREQIMEEKFQQKELLKFKQLTCGHRLFGVKMARRLGYQDEKAEHYIDELVTLYLENPSIEILLKKVSQHLKQAQILISEQQLYDELNHCYREAQKTIG